MTRLFTVLLLLALVAGCGFHLRGQVAIPEPLRTVHIGAPNPNDPLTRTIGQQLVANDVTLAGPGEAPYTLWIEPAPPQRSTVSFDRLAKSAEIQLTLAASYTIRNHGGQVVFGPHRVSVERVFRDDINNINATVNEADLIIQELRSQLAQLIVLQYSALHPSNFTTPAATPKQPAATP